MLPADVQATIDALKAELDAWAETATHHFGPLVAGPPIHPFEGREVDLRGSTYILETKKTSIDENGVLKYDLNLRPKNPQIVVTFAVADEPVVFPVENLKEALWSGYEQRSVA